MRVYAIHTFSLSQTFPSSLIARINAKKYRKMFVYLYSFRLLIRGGPSKFKLTRPDSSRTL
jgi:hypothetical protein